MLRTCALPVVAAMIVSLLIGFAPAAFAKPVDGPVYGRHRVQAHSSDRFAVTLRGGEGTTIFVSGDGDTDLDLYLFDENGRLVDSDTDDTDDCLIRIYPRWTGPFVIVVRNWGSVYNDYRIAVY